MIRHYRAGLRYAQLAADLLVVAASFLLAWYLRFEIDLIPRWAPIPDFRAYLVLLGLILVVWAVLLERPEWRARGGSSGHLPPPRAVKGAVQRALSQSPVVTIPRALQSL